MNRAVIHPLLLAGIGLLFVVRPVAAQSSVYITGVGFAEIKQFDRVAYDPFVYPGNQDDSSMDATGAGGGLRIGTFLHPRWSLELAIDIGSRTERVLPNPYVSILAIYPTLRVPELATSTRFLTVSTVIGFHPAKIGRIQLGYLGGFSFVRGIHESELPDFCSPLGLNGFGCSSFSFNDGLAPVIFPPRPIRFRTVKRADHSAAAIVGFEIVIDLTSRIAAAPGIRTLAASMQGEGVFLIRPEIGVRWSF